MADSDAVAKVQVDEQRVARAISVGLPVLTISTAAVVGVIVGPATSILVLAAGLLLAVIAFLWGSLRILSGDAPLSPELEALDMAAAGVDALSNRKSMLLRTLKDLETERGIGKIDADDFEQIAATYRSELKDILKRIDDSLAPHRARAEEMARAYLEKSGLVEGGDSAAEHVEPEKQRPRGERLPCEKCRTSNEPDAKFCKGCGDTLRTSEGIAKAESSPEMEASDED